MAQSIEGYGWFDRWRVEDSPSEQRIGVLRQWLFRLVDDPRIEPSFESARPHPHPQDELRGAYLFDADAWIVYTVSAVDDVRIIHIGNDAPDGMD